MPVSNDMVLNIYVFCSLGGHKICRHINASLIVFAEQDGFFNLYPKLGEGGSEPYHCVTCVKHRAVLCCSGGLGWCARLQFAVEVNYVSVKRHEEAASGAARVRTGCKAGVKPHDNINFGSKRPTALSENETPVLIGTGVLSSICRGVEVWLPPIFIELGQY